MEKTNTAFIVLSSSEFFFLILLRMWITRGANKRISIWYVLILYVCVLAYLSDWNLIQMGLIMCKWSIFHSHSIIHTFVRCLKHFVCHRIVPVDFMNGVCDKSLIFCFDYCRSILWVFSTCMECVLTLQWIPDKARNFFLRLSTVYGILTEQ